MLNQGVLNKVPRLGRQKCSQQTYDIPNYASKRLALHLERPDLGMTLLESAPDVGGKRSVQIQSDWTEAVLQTEAPARILEPAADGNCIE